MLESEDNNLCPKEEREQEDGGDWVHFYTDGACTKNGKTGARASCGVFCPKHPQLNLSCKIAYEMSQTNEVGELVAVIEALKRGRDFSKVCIISDSEYVINSATKWLPGWMRTYKATGKTKANWDLMLMLDHELSFYKDKELEFRHVAGHEKLTNEPSYSDARGNAVADYLATEALKESQDNPESFEQNITYLWTNANIEHET